LRATLVALPQLQLQTDQEAHVDLESPLRTIASPLEAEVLRVLAGADTEFTAPQIQRIALSGSPFGVRKALARLAEAGLVSANRVGTTQTWRANRRHLLWPAVEIAVDARVRLLDEIRKRVQHSEGLDAYLYGSLARRQSAPDSDIDVLLVFPDSYSPEQIADIAGDLSDNIAAWTGNAAQMFSVTRSELRQLVHEGGSIVRSFDSDAIPIVGPTFSQLRVDLEQANRG
jgi:predicted nucleotidyltransferase